MFGSDFVACRALAPVAVAIFEEMAMAHGLESPFECGCEIWTPFVRSFGRSVARSVLPIRIDGVNKPVASYANRTGIVSDSTLNRR